MVGLPGSLWSQQPIPKPSRQPTVPARADSTRADSVAADSTRPRPGQALDTADARRLGLPTAPRRSFAPEDSVLTELLNRPGFQATRFRSDSAMVFADERRIFLRGEASTKRDLTTLEADSIAYQESDCLIHATGDPALFDRETVLTGFGGIRYNTCIRRGVVTDALTSFKQGSTDWFLRGNLAQDSSAARLYASEGEITSCDLPVPHYHFSAREVKWISKTVMVARPAVLYVRDVPILWLPFVFQDARTGRRSGILIPRFGLNDIVRQNPGYNRQITNVGYYWAPNDYFDVTAKLDWFSNRYRPVRWCRPVSLAEPVPERRCWLQPDVGKRGAPVHQHPLGSPAELRSVHLPQSESQLHQQRLRAAAERDRPAALDPADRQRRQLLEALRLGHGLAGRKPAAEPLGQQCIHAASVAGGESQAHRHRPQTSPGPPG